jgi:predicted ester cyclase
MKYATLCLLALALQACTNGAGGNEALQAKVDSLQAVVDRYAAERELTEMRLAQFDTLDFEYYSNQRWDQFHLSHADDIRVVYPDGGVTVGLEPEHIDMLLPMFVFAPDTKILQHPVRFGAGDWTAVIGEMEGTFSEPMPTPEGGTIPPTGRLFKLSMATIGHWQDGKMVEEYLFWDNQALLRQIGLAE